MKPQFLPVTFILAALIGPPSVAAYGVLSNEEIVDIS